MFLTVMTVAEALAALTPVRRSAVVPAAPALGVVPARDVTTLERLPAWPRATVDGYAVRAADTYAASETLPAFLEVTGTVAMAREPDGEVAPGGGVLQAGEEALPGDVLAPAGRPLRGADLGLLAAAGVTELLAHARPRVGIVSTGDEVVQPGTAELRPGEVRDACAPALAGLVHEAGGEPVRRGIVPDDPAELQPEARQG